jgi:hypothetical protein
MAVLLTVLLLSYNVSTDTAYVAPVTTRVLSKIPAALVVNVTLWTVAPAVATTISRPAFIVTRYPLGRLPPYTTAGSQVTVMELPLDAKHDTVL